MGMKKGLRNPKWGVDELILALDLYMRHKGQLPDANHPDVQELSAILRKIDPSSAKRFSNFRNPTSVVMKLQNFQRLDPAAKRPGLRHGGNLEIEVWGTFRGRQEHLREQAEMLKAKYRVFRDR